MILIFLLYFISLKAQVKTEQIHNIEVSQSTVVKMGQTKAVRDLAPKSKTSKEKKGKYKSLKQVPDNFKGRRGQSKAVDHSREFQGPDPLRQTDFSGLNTTVVEPVVNVQGIGAFGSPHDPSGDISSKYYVQMINQTVVGVFDIKGNLIEEFAANVLWSSFGGVSVGDPIVLYDESVDRWLLTEFSDPANIFIAITDTDDPLGTYTAYNFATPTFPDYPKYGLTENSLVFSSNEEGPTNLHQYFIDLKALYRGDEEVSMQRIVVQGNGDTEAGFYLTTPVDVNGVNPQFDSRPITMLINDSSWANGPEQDQIELYRFDIDYEDPNNTTVEKTSIVTTPFDGFPCAEVGQGFGCIPQQTGHSLDGIPELVMNIPHIRNFGTHESLVCSFITDATDGENISGIRWVELRRTEDTDWELYQEGTFAPDDDLHRFMSSIAMDDKGNIGLAYNVSGENTYPGIRFTGRYADDSLGVMTVEEFNVISGRGEIVSGERFGDYAHMTVSPKAENTFWYTTEYASEDDSRTRILAFKLHKDSIDLALRSIENPRTASGLTSEEFVSVEVVNSGLTPLADFNVSLLFDDVVQETIAISDTLAPDSTLVLTFNEGIDLSIVDFYDIGAAVSAEMDENPFNDTLFTQIRSLHAIEAGIEGSIKPIDCTDATPADIRISNDGGEPIDLLELAVYVDEVLVDTAIYEGSLSFNQSADFTYEVEDLEVGMHIIRFDIISVNGSMDDGFEGNNSFEVGVDIIPDDHFITLDLTTDEYPEETSWTIFYQDSDIPLESGSYSQQFTEVSTRICVDPDSCFRFEIVDAFGDGICCEYGEGSFEISNNEGNVVVSNDGDYGTGATIEFCAQSASCNLSAEISTTDASSSTSVDGSILIEVSSGVEPFEYSIDGGETFQSEPLFDNLAAGTYEIVVKDNTGVCQIEETVEVAFTSSTFDINGQVVTVKISPNPTEDIFKVRINDLQVSERMLNIQIYNLQGRLIQSRNIGNYNGQFVGTFSLMDFPTGTYFVRIDHRAFNFMEKIIKI